MQFPRGAKLITLYIVQDDLPDGKPIVDEELVRPFRIPEVISMTTDEMEGDNELFHQLFVLELEDGVAIPATLPEVIPATARLRVKIELPPKGLNFGFEAENPDFKAGNYEGVLTVMAMLGYWPNET